MEIFSFPIMEIAVCAFLISTVILCFLLALRLRDFQDCAVLQELLQSTILFMYVTIMMVPYTNLIMQEIIEENLLKAGHLRNLSRWKFGKISLLSVIWTKSIPLIRLMVLWWKSWVQETFHPILHVLFQMQTAMWLFLIWTKTKCMLWQNYRNW